MIKQNLINNENKIYIDNIIENIKDIIKKANRLKETCDKIINIGNDFIELNKKNLDDKYFDNIKAKYKEFSESIASLPNFLEGIKNKKDNINIKITQIENLRRNPCNLSEILFQDKDKDNENSEIVTDLEEFLLNEKNKKIKELNGKIKAKENIKSVNIQIINLDHYYYYSVSFCCKTQLNNDFDSLIKELKNADSNNKMCLSKIHKNVYVNDIIKSNKFDDNNAISKFINECPKLFEINEIKSLKDFLINQCKIKNEDLDYRGNGILFNRSNNNKRGQEKYDPPYGCISLGLRSAGKYENDDWLNNNSILSEWGIAYHGVGNLSSHSDIILMLFNIIKYGLKPGNTQDKMGQKDKRHPQNTIGRGIYLNPIFKDAEDNSGIVIINKKQYKIILMTRVLIDKISEPEDAKQWILQKEHIRINRILFKRVG